MCLGAIHWGPPHRGGGPLDLSCALIDMRGEGGLQPRPRPPPPFNREGKREEGRGARAPEGRGLCERWARPRKKPTETPTAFPARALPRSDWPRPPPTPQRARLRGSRSLARRSCPGAQQQRARRLSADARNAHTNAQMHARRRRNTGRGGGGGLHPGSAFSEAAAAFFAHRSAAWPLRTTLKEPPLHLSHSQFAKCQPTPRFYKPVCKMPPPVD